VILNVATVAHLRAKVEEREVPLWAIRIRESIDDPKLVNGFYVKMYFTTGRREVIGSGDGDDEASVHDKTPRLAELMRQAADRCAAPRPHPHRTKPRTSPSCGAAAYPGAVRQPRGVDAL
jgi:hypothetical protein